MYLLHGGEKFSSVVHLQLCVGRHAQTLAGHGRRWLELLGAQVQRRFAGKAARCLPGAIAWPHRLTLSSQMIFEEFVELVTRRARAMCGGGVALPEAIAAHIGAETIPKLQRCQLARS